MNIIIFGCGQGGRAVKNWLPADNTLIAFADNNPQKWGTAIDGVPVIRPADIPAHRPDLVWIAVLNREAEVSIRAQLADMGFSDHVQGLSQLRARMDLRLAHLRLLAREISDRRLPGAVAELGVYQGAFAAEINRLFPERTLYLFDTFEGFSARDLAAEAPLPGNRRISANSGDFGDTSAGLVLARLPHPERAIICAGHFPESLPPDLPPLAFVSLDADLYEPTLQGLAAFWPRLVSGGSILIHDYNSTQFPGVGRAVREFCGQNRLTAVPLADLHGSAVLLKGQAAL